METGKQKYGWDSSETEMLWNAASEALENSAPVSRVFKDIATKTGRRPDSVRNFYYSLARERNRGHARHFVPFGEADVRSLVERVLRAKAQGRSVRACLMEMAGGDYKGMLRLQNKYCSVLKGRPELVKETVEKLAEDGVNCKLDVTGGCRRITKVDMAAKITALRADLARVTAERDAAVAFIRNVCAHCGWMMGSGACGDADCPYAPWLPSDPPHNYIGEEAVGEETT